MYNRDYFALETNNIKKMKKNQNENKMKAELRNFIREII